MARLTGGLYNEGMFWLLGLLAQSTQPGAAPDAALGFRRALMWVLLLIVAFVVLVLLAMWFRRHFLGGPKRREREPIGFSLSDLRRLRDEGKITTEEYERTRDRLVHSAQVIVAEAEKDRPRADAPRTKDVDLIREAER